ncbi:hypothetical protein HYH03_004971 [Edaphochlamys debaryana]|uniref:Sulfotransferase n=1 Tax=Edaphochlamys debaryana TaxID=47281 RepID=A0A835Y698_9CHLO|nr:hypothetical protein HYH03_004971 [Edaphochlamys debaryana]|eukprot:KAG2496965.1 hypothetical protein HYH03_004971 [Edaphochlamys debaryana]
MIIGAAKGGTTDLHYQLTGLPVNNDPKRPDPPIKAHLKEARFMNWPLVSTDMLLNASMYAKYLGKLTHPCAETKGVLALRQCVSVHPPQQLTIDASPMYWYSPHTALQLRSISLDTKVILMLRHPLEGIVSLYNHRVIEDGVWKRIPLDALVDGWLDFLASHPAVPATLERLRGCPHTRCQEEGWRDLVALGLTDTLELRMFSSALYRYGLASWRRHYFRPNRVLIIDSHAYFRDRPGVMKTVVRFMYGRDMTRVEADFAAMAPAQNVKKHNGSSTAPQSSSSKKPNWMLSDEHRRLLEDWLQVHVLDELYNMLAELRDDGAWIVGFDQAPWPWALDGDAGGSSSARRGSRSSRRIALPTYDFYDGSEP